MAFPPIKKTMAGLLEDLLVRMTLVERRLAKAGGGGGGGGDAVFAAGVVQAWSGSPGSIPAGWVLCDGRPLSRVGYPALYAAIGTIYGAGDGSTTFNVPNGKGRVVVGQDGTQVEFDVVGETGGAKTVTLTNANLPPHQHFLGREGGNVAYGEAGGPTMYTTGYGATRTNGDLVTGTSSGALSTPVNNLQPYIVQNWIISTGAGSTNPTGTVVPVQLWQEFTIAGSGVIAMVGSSPVWSGPVTGTLGATLSADKTTINLPAAGTYRAIIHIGAAGASTAAANANANIGGVNYLPSFSYGVIGPAGAWSYETEITFMVSSPTTLRYYVSGSGVYNWSTVRIEKLEPFFPQNALAVTQGSAAQRDAIYGVPANATAQASLANQVITWFNTDKGWYEVYYATTGTAGLTAKGLAAGYPPGWYPAAGSLIWGTATLATDQSAAAGEVRINLTAKDAVGGVTFASNALVLPVGGIYETSAHLYIWATTGSYRGAQGFVVATGEVVTSGTTSSAWDINAIPRGARISAGASIGLRTSGDAANTIRGQSWPALEIRYIGPPLVNG